MLSSYDIYLLNVDITEEPQSVTELVGEAAQFHCAVTGDILIWRVDGMPHQFPSIVARGIHAHYEQSTSGVQSNLTVPATLENNGTSIRCETSSVFSDTVTLTVLPGISVHVLT